MNALPLLASALLLSAPAGASFSRDPSFDFFGRAPAPAPARRAELAAEARNWPAHKAAAQRMLARVPAEARRDGWTNTTELHAVMRQLHRIAWEIETVHAKCREYALAELAALPDGPARREREAAVEAATEAAYLVAYGCLIPLVLEEVFKDTPGDPLAGRRYAGPDWRIVASQDEISAYHGWLVERTGFGAAGWKAFRDRARLELGLPPERP